MGRRLADLLPAAQRTKTLTNGVIGSTWVVGGEIEPHVHHENTLFEESNLPHVKNLKNISGPPEIGTAWW